MEPPLIGSRISLISLNEIRYEGFLYDINKVDTTIALKDVKSFGTEDRVVDKSKIMPPSDSVYPYIKFRGADIKDLHVHKTNDVTPPTPPVPASNQNITFGSVEKATPAPRQHQQQKNPPNKTGADWSNGPPAPVRNQNTNQKSGKGKSETKNTPPKTATQQPRGSKGQSALPGTGEALANRRVRGATKDGSGPEDTSKDFDFFSANSVFNKEEDKAKVVSESMSVPIKKYNPSSFFDDLSNDTSERSRSNLQEERRKNSETFGATSLQDNSRRRYNNRDSNSNRDSRKGGKGNSSYNAQPASSNPPYNNQTSYNRGAPSAQPMSTPAPQRSSQPPQQQRAQPRPTSAAQALTRGLPQQQAPRNSNPPPPPARPATAAAAVASTPAPPADDGYQQVKRKNNRNNRSVHQNNEKSDNKNSSKTGKGKGKGKGGQRNNTYQSRN